MTKKRQTRRDSTSTMFERARDELFSHIVHCGVLQAVPEHQQAWFDDTMKYLGERYHTLSDEQLDNLRVLGERYCRPVKSHASEPAVTEA